MNQLTWNKLLHNRIYSQLYVSMIVGIGKVYYIFVEGTASVDNDASYRNMSWF